MTLRISAIPGLPPLIAAAALLALWELAAHTFDISGLPPAHLALREVPAILGDPEALLNILASIRRIRLLRAGCDTCRRSAARPECSVSDSTSSACRSASSISIT